MQFIPRVDVRVLVVTAGFGIALGAANGCGGTTESAGGHPAVSQSELPQAIAQTICQNIGPCCQAAGLPLDPSKCTTVLTQTYKSVLPEADGGTYDSTASGPCLDSIRATVAQCQFNGTGPASEACSPLFDRQGSHRNAGDPCDETCTRNGSSVGCSGFASSGTGGAPAASGTCYTNDGLYCDHQTSVCKSQSAVGATCTYDEECAHGYCQGTCQALLSEGTSCDALSFNNRCVEGLHCDSTTNMCAQPGPEGAACRYSTDCATRHCDNVSQKCAAEQNTQYLTLACAG